MTSYCMSKAGLDHFTRCIALEGAPFGIRVNSVNPGAIYTPIMSTEEMFGEKGKFDLETVC